MKSAIELICCWAIRQMADSGPGPATDSRCSKTAFKYQPDIRLDSLGGSFWPLCKVMDFAEEKSGTRGIKCWRNPGFFIITAFSGSSKASQVPDNAARFCLLGREAWPTPALFHGQIALDILVGVAGLSCSSHKAMTVMSTTACNKFMAVVCRMV